jgi:7-keto-8-aminopelargonate synthetase-like enzyme
VQTEPERRHCLDRHVRRLCAGLRELGYSVGPTQSQIIPIVIGEDRATMAVCRYLLRHGVFVQGIRPPTVPSGTARLRLTPMATHSAEQIEQVLAAFSRLSPRLKSSRSSNN